jgi:carboxylate-amine ligase
VFATFPRSGLPPRFDDYGQFELVVSGFESAGYVDDYTYLWWDLRPHPRLGTLEVRVMDTVPRIDEALALVAYVQALAKHVVEDGDGAAPHDELIRESKWQAIRRGLEARVYTPRGFAPVRDAVARTLERIAPHAEELGGAAYLTGIERILAGGNSADRQRAAFASGKDVVAVAAELVAETATPAPEPSLAGS